MTDEQAFTMLEGEGQVCEMPTHVNLMFNGQMLSINLPEPEPLPDLPKEIEQKEPEVL
jgi:hypothetical protein